MQVFIKEQREKREKKQKDHIRSQKRIWQGHAFMTSAKNV